MKPRWKWAAVALVGSALSLSAQNKSEIKANSQPAVGCVQRVGEGFVLMSADGNLGLLGGEDLADHVGETVKVTGRRGKGEVTVKTIETVRGDCDDADRASQASAEHNARPATGKRDRGITADDQGGSKADRETTAKIRRALVDDDSLSMMAHNVKIITRNGQVTLRGRVASETEKSAVLANVKAVLGDADIDNKLTVKGAQ